MRTARSVNSLRVILILSALVILTGLLFGISFKMTEARVFFASELAAAHVVETISYRGTTYNVGKDGNYGQPLVILKLAYEKASARYSPVFASPGVNPNAFLAAIDELKYVQELLALKQTDEMSRSLVAAHLYPIDLLRSLAELERSRVRFLSSGSDHDARAYRIRLREIALEHSRASRAYERAFTAAVPPDAREYVTDTKIISREGVLAAIRELRAAATRSAIRTRERQLCITGLLAYCSRQDITLPTVTVEQHRTRPVSERALRLAQDARALSIESGINLSADDSLYLTAHSACVKETSDTLPFHTFETLRYDDGPGFLGVFYVGDILAIDASPYEAVPFFRYFVERGVTILPARPLKHYRCPEASGDSAKVLAMANVREFAKRNVLSVYAPPHLQSELEPLERALASGIVREDDAASYLVLASTEEVLFTLDPRTRDEFISVYLQFALGSFSTFQEIRDIVQSETLNAYIYTQGLDTRPDALYLFFARNGFIALLLGNNKSAAGEHGELFKQNTLSDAEQPTLRLSALKLTEGTRRKIVEDFAFYDAVHQLPQ